jgi:hypothetical protein
MSVRFLLVAAMVLASAALVGGCASASSSSPRFTVREVRLVFARHGMPLRSATRARFGGANSAALDPLEFTRTKGAVVIHPDDFVVFVFADSSTASTAIATAAARQYVNGSRGGDYLRGNVVLVWSLGASEAKVAALKRAVRSL